MIEIEHAYHVSAISKAIGEHMKLDDKTCVLLGIAGMFHDIGKMGVPARLLNKAAMPSVDEHKIIQWHTTVGYNLLSHMPDDIHRLSAEVALCHHERMDGSGYMGMQGDDIPLMERIVAFADVYDALTSDRPYRQAWERKKATEYIKKNKDILFDSRVVKALCLSLKE